MKKAILILLIVVGVLGISAVFKVSNLQAENEQLREQVSIQKYKCPPLDEIGEYTINEKGELTSPSGKIINCEVIE